MRNLFLFLLLPSVLFGQKNYADLIERHMQAQMQVNQFSGVVLVAKNDSIVFKKAYGLASRETNISNEPGTKFRIASITKQFTAACILLLEQRGQVSVNDKLSKYFPDFPNGDSISLHQLLCHRSGIGDYSDSKKYYSKTHLYSHDEIIAHIKKMKTNFPPGTKYSYSNSNYFLLGCIIEKISGKSFEDFVTENIFKPLSMKNSGVDKTGATIPGEAKGYELHKKTYQPAQSIQLDAAYAAGAIYSTVDDLYRWSLALSSTNLLFDASKAKMFTSYSFTEEHYGYGAIMDSFFVYPRIWHSGGIDGFTAQLVRFPESKITITLLSNNEADCTGIANMLSGIMLDKTVAEPFKPEAVQQNVTMLKKYTGKYNTKDPVEIILKGHTLYRHRPQGKDVALKSEGVNKFAYADNSQRHVEFIVDTSGNVQSVDFYIMQIKVESWDKR